MVSTAKPKHHRDSRRLRADSYQKETEQVLANSLATTCRFETILEVHV